MKIIKLLPLLFVIAFASCDKVDDPFPSELGKSIFLNKTEYIVDKDFNVGNTNELNSFINNNTWTKVEAPDNSTRRFITLEEFTGHKCTFCPDGTREIIRLSGVYNEQLIPVGIHAGGFAEPKPTANKFYTDFRAKGGHGEIYMTTFKVAGFPTGVVSRLGDANGKNDWEQDIISIKDDAPSAILKMTNHYAASINAVRSNIEITWLESRPEDFNLQLYVTEDHIIDWQLDKGFENPNYDHRHVLRKVVNDTYGKALIKSEINKTEKIEYIFTVEPGWKAQDMEVVAFIFNSDQTSYEVIQANAAHVK